VISIKALHPVTFLLTVVGALNWGLIGLFDFNLVNTLLGSMPMVEKVVYILVGASAVYLVVTHKTDCRLCGAK
jgi:uncharacterized protein